MGVLNITPDSFSDGGKFYDPNLAFARAIQMIEEGADILDIGGESTRPGAAAVSVATELERVLPVIQLIRNHSNIPISIDTTKSVVADAALNEGADFINDISAASFDPLMLKTALKFDADICLMHIQGTPATMQNAPTYKSVVQEVKDFLLERIEFCLKFGLNKPRIWLDPGIGFGKTVEHNLQLIQNLHEICELGYPVIIGTSRKGFIGSLLNNADPKHRLEGTITTSVLAINNGTSMLRVHDISELKRAVMIADAVIRQA